jgi:ElaB/YqjD/DUF883 family membrane-anchored ribosome-binding protein
MFGRQPSRAQKAERVAAQAWENVVSTIDNAGASARSAGRRAAGAVDGASDRVGSGAKEARRRANAALEALSGRKPARPWGWLAAFALVGMAVGWLGTLVGRQARQHDPLELSDSFDTFDTDPAIDTRPTRIP